MAIGTAKNAKISPIFLVLKFCGKAQFCGNPAETVPFHKISVPGN